MQTYNLPLHDFSNAYFGAKFLLENQFNSSIWDALIFNEMVKADGSEGMFVAYYPNTPFLAFFFSGIAWIKDAFLAKLLFNILSSLLLVIAVFRLQKALGFSAWILLLMPMVFFTTIRNSLYFGQVYFLLFFLIIEGMLALEKKVSGPLLITWSTAILLKVFPVLLLLLLLVRQNYRALIGLSITCFLLIISSLVLVEMEAWIYYIEMVFPKSSQGVFYDGFTPKAKSATMLFKNLFVEDEVFNPKPFFNSYTAYLMVQVMYKTIIIGTVVWFSWKRKATDKENRAILFQQVGIFLLAGMLVSTGWSSYASILLVLPMLLVLQAKLSLSAKGIFVGLVFLYCNIPLSYFWELPLLLKFPKVYLLWTIFFFYVYLLKGKEAMTWKLFGGIYSLAFIFFMLTIGLGRKAVFNQYALEEETQILISDFSVENGFLVYEYWALPSTQKIQTNYPVNCFSVEALSLKNNQIYYKNKAITTSQDKKRKPMLINQKEIIYLSDQNRGTGFYTLLKISVE